MKPTESFDAALDHAEELEPSGSMQSNENSVTSTDEELTDKEKLQSQRQLKPYDYKLQINDNDEDKVIKIYSKCLSFIVYRTERAIRIDIDDEHEEAEGYW